MTPCPRYVDLRMAHAGWEGENTCKITPRQKLGN
jgi:hypothetical protein